MKSIYVVLGFILFAALHTRAQTAGNSIGQKVEIFTLENANGQKITLADFASNKAVVVAFTNNHCPYSQLYEKRLQQLTSDYSSKGVKFLFIQPIISTDNTAALDKSPDNNTANASVGNFPHLVDTNQKVTQQLGATKTPEVFVLQPENGIFLLRYKGAIDDNPQVESYVKEAYLKIALDAVLANQTPTINQKRATGCTIKRF